MQSKFFASFAFCCLMLSISASGQEFQLMRYDENYEYLKDSVHNFYNTLKFLPLSKDNKKYVSMGGEARLEWVTTHNEQGKKGDISVGMLADLTVLDQDYFMVPEEQIKDIESAMTIVDGKIVFARDEFSSFSPAPIPILPDWSPANIYNGYNGGKRNKIIVPESLPVRGNSSAVMNRVHHHSGNCAVHGHDHRTAVMSSVPVNNYTTFWGALGCSCFAF